MEKFTLKKTAKFTIFLSSLLLLILLISLFNQFVGNSNFLDDGNINKSVGWAENQSFYSGSELSFAFNNSDEISFELNSDSISDQGVEIFVDDKNYLLSSPNLENQKLSISVDKSIPHTLTIRHFCTYLNNPCQIELKGIYLNKNAKITPFQAHTKTLSILGDSISTNYGKENYSLILAKDLGYELHNASILGSTASDTSDMDNAINRYKKDMMDFKSDVIIIFIGSNDAANKVSLELFEENYSKIVSDLKQFNPESEIFLVGILPRKDVSYEILNNYSTIIQIVGERHEVVFVNPISWLDDEDFSDDVHPSLESQKEIAKHFQQAIIQYLN